MLKVAITGHTSGIGRALFTLMQDNYDVSGFSRSNGHDINDIDSLLPQVLDYDIFVNNAYDGYAQARLFERLYAKWKYQNKTIVNIGSRAKYLKGADGYAAEKKELDKVANKVYDSERVCRICNINPGWVQTPSTKKSIIVNQYPSISVIECARYIIWAIEQPIEIGELSFWNLKEIK